MTPPQLLRRPADAPPPLPHLRDGEAVQSLHRGWAGLFAAPTTPSLWRRAIGKARRSLPFGSGDRALLGALVRAVDTVAGRCDELADRLATLESATEDVVASFGQDITQLRAEVAVLRSATSDRPNK